MALAATQGVTLLDRFLPGAPVRQIDRIAVAASPAQAYAAVRSFDVRRSRWVRALLWLGAALERVSGHHRGGPRPHAALDRAVTIGTDLALLGEVPGREVVVGSPGRLALGLRVDGREAGGSWITCELRVAGAPTLIKRGWRLAGPVWRATARDALRRLQQQLGGPGAWVDDSVIIEAPPSRVWPWLLRSEAHRADWSSVEPGRSLVVGTGERSRAITLEPIGDDATLLSTRTAAGGVVPPPPGTRKDSADRA